MEVEATVRTTAEELIELAHAALDTDGQQQRQLKLLYKGKRLAGDCAVFSDFVQSQTFKKSPKIMVLATEASTVAELNSKRSDPTIRGFDQERQQQQRPSKQKSDFWGPTTTAQDKNYKFCRFQACTWQSFGHRPLDSTPHDFAALQLLERLATDPGIVAVLKERELVVGTLGEMDPIDDRLMHQHQQQQQGSCLLGYNTNAGARIDLKLRTDDLKAFRPYPQICATLIHELSHNWVGEHNLLFWTNYGQMRAEYVCTHAFATAGRLVQGQTTAQRAGLPPSLKSMEDVFQFVMEDVSREMAQFHLDPNMIAGAIRDRCNELWLDHQQSSGRQLGGDTTATTTSASSVTNSRSPRAMALQAAERRRRREDKEKNPENK